MNRKNFTLAMSDRIITLCANFCRCFRGWCPRRYSLAEKQRILFNRGKKKLEVDLDIVNLIQRNQMNDVNKEVLFTEQERFLLQF